MRDLIIRFTRRVCAVANSAKAGPLTITAVTAVFRCQDTKARVRLTKWLGGLVGKASRDKGARVERLLRDELTRHGWDGATRVPLSGAMKTRIEYQSDVTARPPGYGSEVTFECKARAKGFEAIYGLASLGGKLCFSVGSGDLCVLTLDPNLAIESASFPDITTFDPATQKVMRSIVKKCHDWIGTAMILALKQDRNPFIYVRFRR